MSKRKPIAQPDLTPHRAAVVARLLLTPHRAAVVARLLLPVAIVGFGVAYSACGGSSGASTTPVTQSTPSSAPTTPTAGPPYDVNGSTYRFSAKGYSVDIPDGWTARPNYLNDVSGGQFPVDALLFDPASSEAAPSITIECLKADSAQSTTEAFRDARAAFLKQISKSVAAPRPIAIGNQSGYAIDSVQEIPQGGGTTLSLDKTDAVVVVGGCRWLIGLSVPTDYPTSQTVAFETMLHSMRFFTPE